jgi:hypothetical protein
VIGAGTTVRRCVDDAGAADEPFARGRDDAALDARFTAGFGTGFDAGFATDRTAGFEADFFATFARDFFFAAIRGKIVDPARRVRAQNALRASRLCESARRLDELA